MSTTTVCGRRNVSRSSPSGLADERLEPRPGDRVEGDEHPDRHHGADETLQHALQQERRPDDQLRRAHQAHDLELLAPCVQHERGGRRHGEDRGEREHGAHPEADDVEQALAAREPLDPVDAAADLVGLGQRGQRRDQRAGGVGRGALRGGRHLERRGQRIRRQLLGHAGVLAEHLLEGAERLGLAHVAHGPHAGHPLDPLHQRLEVGRRRLALEVHDDAHAVAPVRGGLADVRRHQPEAAEGGERERDQQDGGDRDAPGAPQVAQRLADEEAST